MRTGIFFHYQKGERLKDFPSVLGDLINREGIIYYDALYQKKLAHVIEPVGRELLLKVHSAEMIERVQTSPSSEGALYSAGGTVMAIEKILGGEIDNAFVFTGFGDHHAGRDFFGGGCYLNSAALAIANARDKFRAGKFAILDTDPHHGDGSWDIFQDDEEVLYTCCCNNGDTDKKHMLDIHIPFQTSDKEYLTRVEEVFLPRVTEFAPEIIFWNFGYDGTRGEYGDIGLSRDCHIELAKMLKTTAGKVCKGRLAVVLCGGSGRETANYIIPRVISCLAGG